MKEDNTPLESFQGRTNERVIVKPTNWFSKIEKGDDGSIVYVTNAKSSKGRTYRFHEAHHLNFTPGKWRLGLKKIKPWARMGIEDVILHINYMPDNLPLSVLRDEKSSALQDMRAASWILKYIESSINKDEIDDRMKQYWNHSCIMALRSKAILGRTPIKGKKHSFGLPEKIEKICNKTLTSIKLGMLKSAGTLFDTILFETQDPEVDSGLGIYSGNLLCTGMADLDTTFELPGNWIPPVGNLKPTPELNPKQKEGPLNPMPIIELKIDTRTKLVSHARDYRYRSSGSHPNPFRLARASFSPITNLFKIKVRHEELKATFLLDASGSMGISGEGLSLILEQIPAATIAYYSSSMGHSDGLKIYSIGGMRSSDKYLIGCSGGNDWDHQALQWLLKQKPPWFFITDCCFSSDYGKDPGQIKKARELLSEKRHKINMYSSYTQLLSALKSGWVKEQIKGERQHGLHET